jgi:PAS domain S-box-containing protein
MNDIDSNFISDLSPEGIVFINNTSKVEYINPAFSDITGYSSKNLIGLDEDAFNAMIRDLCDVNSGGEAFNIKAIENFTVMQLSEPVRRFVSCSSRVINNEEGISQGRVLFFHDITRDQERDERMKSEFLSVAAHKLRTPLVGILGFSELLTKRDFGPVEQKNVTATIFRQAANLKQMLDDFLDIERLDIRKGRDFIIEKGTLEKVLNEVLTNPSHISEKMEIIFEPPVIWPEVNFDYDKMKQVFTDLISNAVKYSPEGNVVCSTIVRSDNGNEEFGVRISDQGIGITPSDLDRVGERFYRANISQSVSGSGLGIAIVKAIVAIHKGRFDLRSIKGKGTTATVWLPTI